MQEVRLEEALDQIIAADPRYHRDAYTFVREALDHSQRLFANEERDAGRRTVSLQKENHVTGQQLLEGIRECALGQFGPMAATVLEEWGIHECRDFGNIVFNMVESQLLRKTEKDTRDDFAGGYDFKEAFRKPFLPSRKLGSAPPSSKPEPA